MKKEIRALLLAGVSNRQICKDIGCSSATVSYHARKLGIKKKPRPSYDWSKVQAEIDSGRRLVDIRNEIGFSKSAQTRAISEGLIIPPKTISQMDLDELLLLVAGRRTKSHERRHIRRAMIESGVPCECAECELSRWRGRKLTLELDHIDGDPTNNVIENLRLLCPNCHSITETWRGRNHKRRKFPSPK